jgi:hypothetical protein
MTARNVLLRATILASALGWAGAASVGGAQAQQNAAAPPAAGAAEWSEAEDGSAMVPPFNVPVDDLEDMAVVGAGGEEIGEVEEVLADPSGKPAALAVEAGGFLGVGEKTVVVGLDRLRLENDQLVTGMDKEQVEALPEWDD